MDASGQTLANLQARGYPGYVQTLVASNTTNAATAAEKTLANLLLDHEKASNVSARIHSVVQSYLDGKPVANGTLLAEIFDLQYAFAAHSAALGEIGTIMAAHAGTTSYVVPAGIGMAKQINTLS